MSSSPGAGSSATPTSRPPSRTWSPGPVSHFKTAERTCFVEFRVSGDCFRSRWNRCHRRNSLEASLRQPLLIARLLYAFFGLKHAMDIGLLALVVYLESMAKFLP